MIQEPCKKGGEDRPVVMFGVKCAESPGNELKESFVPAHLPAGEQHTFPDDISAGVEPDIVAQVQEAVDEFGLVEKGQAVPAVAVIIDIEVGEKFQLVDEPFFGAVCALGNPGQQAKITAEQGDDFIRFAMVKAVEDNGGRLQDGPAHKR